MRTFDQAIPPQRLAHLEIGADNGTLQFLDAAGRGAFADEAFRNMVLWPVLPAQVVLVDDVAEVRLLCRDEHAVGRWRGGGAATISDGFERLARTAALIPATRATPRTARRAVFIFIVGLPALCELRIIALRAVASAFRMQRRGGPRKTGSGLQHANANPGLKDYLNFLFIIKAYNYVCGCHSRYGCSYS
jgi:hypothetical protein